MNDSNDIALEKANLRRRMRSLLAGITSQQREAWSHRLVEWLMTADFWAEGAGMVALFGGLKSEPDLLPLLPWLREQGREVALFAVGGDGVMHAHRVCGTDDLVTGPFGILMPDVSKCPRVVETTMSVVLVPGLAFSVCDGARLGRGKGYYDRVLAGLGAETRVIGAGFSVQMIESVPREPHDQCLRSLVCEVGWRAVPLSA